MLIELSVHIKHPVLLQLIRITLYVFFGQVCGAGCSYVEGEEECHDKTITTVINVPEEICDLNPQKSCRLSTKLVPKLEPVREGFNKSNLQTVQKL